MFREFIDALRKRPLLTQMFDEMEQMLDSGVEMYRMISAVLTGKETLTEETHDRVYEIDRGINHLQRKIRKQLVQHLIVSPGTDVPISLILMSIIKDAERVGDITKNLLEVAEAQGGAFREGKYDRRFRELLVETESLFEPTVEAFRMSDKDLGHDALQKGRDLAQECDALIDNLIDENLVCKEAVLYALTARYLKRIALHLSNIASSVVMPLHKLDYFDES